MMKNKTLRSIKFLTLLTLSLLPVACRRHEPEPTTVVSDQKSAAGLVAQADQMYAERENIVRVKQGLILLHQALNADYKNYEAAWRLAMFNYYVGSHTKDENEREKSFRDGIEKGKLAVKLQDDKPEGHFWLGANYGGSAQGGILAGLSAIQDIQHEMETVIRIDKTYQGASAYLVLGQVYLEAPRMFGGDVNKAVEVLEQGVHVEPDNSMLRLQMAKAYLTVKREKDARQQLNYIISMKPDPDYLPEFNESVNEAHQILNKLGR